MRITQSFRTEQKNCVRLRKQLGCTTPSSHPPPSLSQENRALERERERERGGRGEEPSPIPFLVQLCMRKFNLKKSYLKTRTKQEI